MNPGRFFAIVAERALATGRPLHEELEAVGALSGGLPHPAVRAIDFARNGKLGEALEALEPLGFDPLLAEASALRPETASEVSGGLARLPRGVDLLRPLAAPFVYLTVVIAFESQVAALLTLKVLPALGEISGASSGLLALAGVAGWVAGLACLAALGAWVLLPRLPAGRRFLYGPLASARVCAAFAPLAAAGVPAEEVFNLARRHAPGLFAELGRSSGLAHDWRELAAHFAERAAQRTGRLALAVKAGGTALAVLLAALILASVYLTLPLIPLAGVGP